MNLVFVVSLVATNEIRGEAFGVIFGSFLEGEGDKKKGKNQEKILIFVYFLVVPVQELGD